MISSYIKIIARNEDHLIRYLLFLCTPAVIPYYLFVLWKKELFSQAVCSFSIYPASANELSLISEISICKLFQLLSFRAVLFSTSLFCIYT